jgi:hypothetical protein
VALISAGSSVLVAITALVLNYRGFSSIDSRFASMEARMLTLETSMTTRFDLIMGKLADLDTRLSLLEDRSKK